MDSRDLRREVAELRHQLRRNQVALVAALAALGLGALGSVGLVGFYGVRLSDEIWEVREHVESIDEASRTRMLALSHDLTRQRQELAAIRKAANDDLEAIQEANRKIAAIRDPNKELAALREANQELWSELASQRSDLLDALHEHQSVSSTEEAELSSRFRLGETDFMDPEVSAGELKGFVKGDEKIHRASALPPSPAHLLIELSPEKVGLGERYRLEVRLVNRSNQPLGARALRLDWSFGGRKNTGGDVPLGVAHVAPRDSAVLYRVSGKWTPVQESGPVSLTATLTLDDGERLLNTLRWSY